MMNNVAHTQLCDHVFVRRRDGVCCIKCGLIEFGREFTDEDREKLRQFKNKSVSYSY
jgi:hypothetical protein